MAEPEALAPLLAALRALVEWLDAAGVRGVVIGGVAASLLGRPRVTRDIRTRSTSPGGLASSCSATTPAAEA